MSTITQFAAARRVSTPLIAVLTQDPAETIRSLVEAEVKENGDTLPVLAWDGAKGSHPLNPAGQSAYASIVPDGKPMLNLVDFLTKCGSLPEFTMVFIHQAHRQLDKKDVSQAIWNLRDAFKQDNRSLILLGPAMEMPADLASDVLTIDEPLPSDADLEIIVWECYRGASIEAPKDITPIVDAVRGLAAFPAEQVVAMSLTEKGIDMDALWERKRKMIEATPGLSVERAPESFSHIGGLESVKTFGQRLFKSAKAPRVIVRLDEIEKYMGGATGGDNTGVSQDFLGVILREMEDNDWAGLIAVGPPGSGKSLFSKALGAEGKVLTINQDLGAAKKKHVGESEAAIRQHMKVIKSIAGKSGAFFVATCNRLTALPPELRRRFRFGIWYFDLPSSEERTTIWSLQAKAFGVEPTLLPDDTDWTGAEIRNCCDLAARMSCSLKEAAEYIVPVAKSDPESISTLREMAKGRFLSGSYAGPYQGPDAVNTQTTGRRIRPAR